MWFRRSAVMWIYFLVISSVKCYGIKISGPGEDLLRLHRNTKQIAEKCLTNHSILVITSASHLDDNWGSGENSLIVIDNEFKKQVTGYTSAYPLYILLFESIDNLETTIEHLQKSTFWSIKSPFLVVNAKSQCERIKLVLKKMWMHNLLATNYLCVHERLTIVFTMNPFENYVPIPWKQFIKFSAADGKEFTIFFLTYYKDEDICENIIFDKTRKLNGHQVNVAKFLNFTHDSESHKLSIIRNYLRAQSNKDKKTVFVNSLISHVNATEKIIYFSDRTKVTSLKSGYNQQMVDKAIDINAKGVLLVNTNYEYMDVLTLYDESTFSILTKKSNYLTTISQVTCYYQFIVLTIVVLILISVIIVINNEFKLSGGILDILSLTSGMGLTPLDQLSMRIIYIFGFLFIFTVMTDFQGQLSAMLSKPLRRNVESLEDLYNNKYHVYYDGVLENDMDKEKLWVMKESKQYLYPSSFPDLKECTIAAQSNATIACIQIRNIQLFMASKLNNLYLSKDIIFKKYYIYWVRKNWSIKDRIDKVSSWYFETGLFGCLTSSENIATSKKLKQLERIEESGSVDFLDFDSLMLSYMMVFGLSTWGLIAFGLELLFHKYEICRRQILIRRGRQDRLLRTQSGVKVPISISTY